MNSLKSEFVLNGYVVLSDVITPSQTRELILQSESSVEASVGTRNLLNFEWVQDLAHRLKRDGRISALLPRDPVAVQCSYFSKSVDSNWSVTPHRDLSIPVKQKSDDLAWSGWSEKEGVLYAQPPRWFVDTLVAIRIHFEDNTLENGALDVVPGSHTSDSQEGERVVLTVKQGGAVLMRPSVLHSSKRLKSGQRRVLHFVFGPKALSEQMAWAF